MAHKESKSVIVAAGAVAAIGLTGLAACGGGAETADGAAATGGLAALPSALTGQRPEWKKCEGLPPEATQSRSEAPSGGPSEAGPTSPVFRCAKVRVPLDYAKPTGETIELAVIRTRATQPQRRIGSLLFNFGGPGGDGVRTLAQAAGDYASLGTRYDLVGFDPRGVGESDPVTCVDDKRMDQITAEDDSPDDPAEERAYAASELSYNQGCRARSGKLLPFVGTISAARDMDVIRTALGDARLHYFGISYGTWLGGSYAHQLPKNVDRAVFDGAVDTKISTADLGLQQAAAFQRALGSFGTACARLGPAACPLGRDSTQVVASIGRLLNGLDAAPLKTASGRTLTQSLGVTGVTAALYSEQAWPMLAQGVTEAVERQDGTTLLSLADLQLGRQEDGHYSNLIAANTAITCADTTDRYTVQDVRRLLPRFSNASPVFGPSMAWGLLQCTGWPVKGDDAAQNVSAPHAAPVVVVGNTGDPATPYAWAPALTKELGGAATLVTLRGQGHGAYDTGNACVRAAVDGYLLDGKVPANGTTCT
ncbi:alpha/beta hydrolase [Spirillospora sp. NBC_01491]|uniref:alpha/beta hydrolase n=1 Tax=Spirillospora sp. NBC_01491 TaxID=2976007 RepID=UPI002E364531|nr:alpha/beta hydrolase [Spirillospora sp. NBC_01491]